VQRGACWLALGHPGRAAGVLETAARFLPASYRRDRGVALSHHAAACAAMGHPEDAARIAGEAAEIARLSGSVRILRLAAGVADKLAAYADVPAVAQLQSVIAAQAS
jgi:hypothetical protein